MERFSNYHIVEKYIKRETFVENSECFICLMDFEEDEEKICLDCDHVLHKGCHEMIDERIKCFCGQISFK